MKKLIATLLALCMILSLLPTTVLAAEPIGSDSDLDIGQEVSEWLENIPGENSEDVSDVHQDEMSDGLSNVAIPEGADSRDNWYDKNDQSPPDFSLYGISDAGSVTRGAWIAELVTLFDLTAEQYPDVYFPDIEDSAYYDAIMTATMCGMIDVEAGDNFEPDSPLTQGFAAQTLNYRLGLQPEIESADSNAQVAMERGWFGGTYLADALVTEEQRIAMLDDARSILASRVMPEPVSYYEFANYVKVVPDTAEVSVQGGTVQITGFTEITQGTVFAFYEQGLAFVYTANYVDNQGDTLFITTVPAPEDAVISAEFAGEIVPELTFIPDENVVTLMDSDGQPVVFGATRELDRGRDWIKFSKSITLANGVTGSLNVSLTNIKLKTHLELFGTKSFLLMGDLNVSSTIKFDLVTDPAAAELFLGQIGLEPFGFVGISVGLQLEAKITYDYSAEFGLGVELSNGKFSDLSYCQGKSTTLSAEGRASAKLSLVGALDFGTLGTANARLSIGPVIKFSARKYSSGVPQTCITLATYIEAGASVYAKFIFQQRPYDKSWPIFTETNSPIRTYEHVEDGVTVYSCTRGGSERTVKYITPAGSRYYVSGNRNGNSSGLGTGGTTVSIWSIKANSDGRTAAVTGYSGGGSVLSIPETIDGYTITSIGAKAFQNNRNIRVVTIPDTVTEVGVSAFENCQNLQTLDFSKSLVKICYKAFAGCSSLVEVNLPEGLKQLGASTGDTMYQFGGAFMNCTSLEHVYIPASLQSCSSYYCSGNFENCPKLDSITFGEGIPIIPDYLFYRFTSITRIEIPDTVMEIGVSAFYGCTKLNSVKIPDAVTEIHGHVFEGCTNLESVDFSENLISISDYAFKGCSSLTEASLPEGLQVLGKSCGDLHGTYYARGGVFADCSSLERVYIPASLETGSGSSAYGNFENCPKLNTITFGEGIPIIPDYLFSKCSSITYIEIPDTVTEVHGHAFEGCTNLQSVDFSENLVSISDYAFKGCSSLTEANLPEGLQVLGKSCGDLHGTYYARGGVFADCSSLERVYIPASLETGSGSSAYGNFENCPKLNAITFGEGIPIIPDYLFSRCTSITQIKIPNTVTEIGEYAFQGCTKLTTVEIPDTVTTYGKNCFRECTALISLKLSNNALIIPDSMFYGCSALGAIDFPAGLTKIGDQAFTNCTSFKIVNLSDSTTTLGSNAFKGCSSLSSVKTGAGLTEISYNCFQECVRLTDVTLNDGLATLRNYAFQGCKALQAIVLPDTVTSLGTYAFQQCDALTDVTLSNSLTAIPNYAFANCKALASIVIPKGVTTIGANAFYQDAKLAEITVPQTVISIGSNAVSYPKNMTVYGCTGSYAENWATTNKSTFVDITAGVTTLSLANGTDRMTIGTSQTVTPMFTVTLANTTDIITLSSDNTNVVSVSNSTALRGVRAGTANITATASSGITYTFAVTVASFTGIEIGHLPNITSYGLKDDMNLDGLVVNAVFANGSKEAVSGYTVKGFDTDTTGVKTITVTYANKTATFDITVAKVETGILTNLTNGKTVNWSYNDVAQTVTISGTIPQGEQVCVARYGEGGRFLGMETVQKSGSIDVSQGEEIQLIWVIIDTYVPVCESKTISK